MLWTDSIFLTQDDLTRMDSEVAKVAQSENIAMTGNNGFLRGVVEEATNYMLTWIVSFGGYLNSGDLSSNHLAAVLNVGIGNSVRQKVAIQQVVVSGDVPNQWSWVKRWVTLIGLRAFYRDAFGRVGIDRYKNKLDFYDTEIQRIGRMNVTALGIPVVVRPLSRPAAFFERNTGTWDSTNVSLVSGGGTLTDKSFVNVAITYVDMSQPNFYVSASNPNNCESEPSDIVTQQMATANVVQVDITSLNPPIGQEHPSQVMVVVVSPLKATHWNVYAGMQGKTLYLQNSSPIPIATKTFALPGDPALSGFTLGIGQYGDRRLSVVPTRQRA